MMNQKEATYQAIVNVTGFTGEGVCEASKDQKKMIYAILKEGFLTGKIQLDRQFDDAGLNQYINGLVSNWLRKDTRLNGGSKYQAKNPGSRAGQGDATLKAMRALLSTLPSDSQDYAEVQAEIDAHVAKIQAAKTKTVDFSALPEHLKLKFSK